MARDETMTRPETAQLYDIIDLLVGPCK